MSRRGYDRRRRCAEEGCKEWSIQHYDLKRDYVAAVAREKGQPAWKCLKHDKPNEVLSPHNPEIVYITEPSRELFSERYPDISHGIRWGTSGTMYGPGFRAWAEDLPLGTQVVVTAQLIFPAGYAPPPAPDAPADPAPALRPIAADVVDLDYIDQIAYDAWDGYTEDDIEEWEPSTPEAVEHKRRWSIGWRHGRDLYPVPEVPAS